VSERSKARSPDRSRARAERQIRYGRFLGLAFCAAGFTAISLGWAGAARESCADCQLPYLLSGGAAGLGMIVFGAVLLVLSQMRADSRRLAERLEGVIATFTGDRAPGRSPLNEPQTGASVATGAAQEQAQRPAAPG
jgi:hypothetical protein